MTLNHRRCVWGALIAPLPLLALLCSSCGQRSEGPVADGERRAPALLVSLAPVAAAPPATDLQPRHRVLIRDGRSGATLAASLPEATAALALPGRAVALVTPDQRLIVWRPGTSQRLIDRDVLGQIDVSPGGRLLVYPKHPAELGSLWLAEVRTGRRWQLSPAGTASLPRFSPDGERIAYVDTSPAGIASLFVVSLAGRAPRQLTNVGLRRRPGQRPVGFVPPPGPAALHWQVGANGTSRLRWRAAGQRWSVAVPEGDR